VRLTHDFRWALLLLAVLGASAGAAGAAESGHAPATAAEHGASTPFSFAWGTVAEPERAGATTPGRVAEHVEFLLAHAWRPVRAGELLSATGTGDGSRPVLLTFDDPASAREHVLPLLELWRVPAAVTVDAAQLRDPALATTLAALAASPWVELLPRVAAPAAPPAVPSCGAPKLPSEGEPAALARLRTDLEAQLAALRRLGETPAAVAWAEGAWNGPAEAAAAALGLTLQLPTFTTMPPAVAAPRVARYSVPEWAGVWALVQAPAGWDPSEHPVRFVAVDPSWVCAGGDPSERLARLRAVVERLGLNGVRIGAGDARGVWFPTAGAPVRGDVVGPLAAALRAAGVRWVAVDLPAPTGDPARDAALAADLARSVALDVAVLAPGVPPAGAVAEAVRAMRPAVRLAAHVADAGDDRAAFTVEPRAPGRSPERGLTVDAGSVAATNRAAAERAVAGWSWIGLPVELAERGLADSLAALAAFALPPR
jgi:hypothetical protein